MDENLLQGVHRVNFDKVSKKHFEELKCLRNNNLRRGSKGELFYREEPFKLPQINE
jgi:hypothetical protein